MTEQIQPHIRLSDQLNVEYALLPGDPARLDRVKPLLTDWVEIDYNREFRSAIGYYKDVKVLVLSTGIGGPSTAIAIEELANIGIRAAIRIGSCGALQDNMEIGDLVIATGAVRDEGTTKAYIDPMYPAIADNELVAYMKRAAEDKSFRYHFGMVRSHDSFYTDQEEAIDAFWSEKGILGADMETSTLFVVGSLRGLRTASILNVVVPSRGSLETGINSFVAGEDQTTIGEKRQIKVALEAIASIQHNQF